MNAHTKRIILLMLALLMTVAMLGVAGCSGDDEGGETSETESTEADDGAEEEMAADENVDQGDLEDGALDIASAWFIGPGSDYSTGDVEFAVAAMVQSEDGSWWARIVATPNDTSMESEQVYVTLADGMTLWTAVDSGTGIDPATDDRFPEDVAAELQP